MGGARSTYGGGEKCKKGFWWGDLREGDHLEDIYINIRNVLLKTVPFAKRHGCKSFTSEPIPVRY